MMRDSTVISILLIFSFFISADSAPPRLKVSDIITPKERGLLLSGGIISYAKMAGKGESFTGGIKASLPQGAGRIYDNPSEYSIAAVEKTFFKGDAALTDSIFTRLTDYPMLKGMQYYSISESKAVPLILESRSSGNRSVKHENGGKYAVLNFIIKDNRLGTIPLSSKVWSGNGFISSASVCSGTVSRLGMKVFEPGDYRVYKFIVYDKTSGGWFYCSVQLMRVRSDILNRIDFLRPENICNRLRGETVHMLGLIGINRKSELAAFR